MKTLKTFVTALMLAIGCMSVYATTETATVNGSSLSSTNTTWAVSGGQNISYPSNTVKIALGNGSGQGIAYVQGTIPATWKVTSVVFNATTNASTTISLTVNGETFTKGSASDFTHATGVTGGPIVLKCEGNASSQFIFGNIVITYTIVSPAPVLTYLASHEAGNNEDSP